jgi:hypothetical protein
VKQQEEWRPVLEAEIKRWSETSLGRLISTLVNVQTYEVKFGAKPYQIEAELLENTDSLIHVGVSVDDGHFWRAMRPLSSSFIREKG